MQFFNEASSGSRASAESSRSSNKDSGNSKTSTPMIDTVRINNQLMCAKNIRNKPAIGQSTPLDLKTNEETEGNIVFTEPEMC